MDVANSIYVGGLAYDSKEDVVKSAFLEYGEVVSVKIVYDRGSGESRGFGFVTFTNPRAALNAIREMNGNQIAGRTVRVNEVRKNRPLGFRDRESGDRDIRSDRDGRDRSRRRPSPPSPRSGRARSPVQQRSRSPRAAGASPARYQSPVTRHRTRSPRSSPSPQSSDAAERTEEASREAVAAPQEVSSRATAKDKKDDLKGLREELVRASENRKALEDKVGSLKGTVERAEQTIALLHSKAQKLEDSLANARQVAAQRHNHLKKLQSGVHQYKTCFERLASSEKEIKALATATLDTEGHGMRVDDEEGDALFTNGGVRASGEVGTAA